MGGHHKKSYLIFLGVCGTEMEWSRSAGKAVESRGLFCFSNYSAICVGHRAWLFARWPLAQSWQKQVAD